ncbi:ZIP family zinc transporter [Allocatelliglobosispora scoriae]|uniref:ZIP family zinc transporter n=1 Tax=Allocatelliglobosispora scoriae TaxID=643052 RepID=A0A841BZ26_9ACTN|nr:ZIP family zinc transporter [Allocatelliglobosispora scoriae]MBB5872836.1 ZIP family zinc transporter [Allocatelliglobosispora scoriae]
MTVWIAIFWGAFSSAALFLGQALAEPMRTRTRATGLVMGFGAGTLLSAIAYQLVPTEALDNGLILAGGLSTGALVYFFADRLLDGRGAATRQNILPEAAGGSGLAMFLGALLDGVPEAFVLGASLSLGGAISIAFLAAVFVSNIPQGVAGTVSMRAAGYTNLHVAAMWGGLTLACGAIAGVGFSVASSLSDGGLFVEAFAAGALLMMLADSMIPEAYQHGGKTVGLLTVAGYLAATALAAI